MTAKILAWLVPVFLAAPCARASLLKFDLTEGRAVSADPANRDPGDSHAIAVYFQEGRLIQGRAPSPKARFCQFHLDPRTRPIDEEGEPPMTHFLMPGKIVFRVRVGWANGNRSLDLVPVGANGSHLVKVHCEDPTESRAFTDPASHAKVLQGIWGEWMVHVPDPPPKGPDSGLPAECRVTPVVEPMVTGNLETTSRILDRLGDPPPAEAQAGEETVVSGEPGEAEAWEEMQGSFEDAVSDAVSGSGESGQAVETADAAESGDVPGPAQDSSEPLRCDSPPSGEATPAVRLAEEVLSSDGRVTFYLKLIRSAALTYPADSRIAIWQVLGRQAFHGAVNARIRAMSPEARRALFQGQLDYLREVDNYYLVCENAGGKP